MKALTQAEEEVMQLLWQFEKAYVRDLLERWPDPKPAYNTVSTIIRILEQKGFVGHEPHGKTHAYYPLVSKETYSSYAGGNLIQKYFDGSLPRLVAHLAQEESLSTCELDQLLAQLQALKNQKS